MQKTRTVWARYAGGGGGGSADGVCRVDCMGLRVGTVQKTDLTWVAVTLLGWGEGGGWVCATATGLRQAPASDTGESQPQARSIQKRNQGVHLSCVIHRRRAERRQREHHCDDKACTVAAETE